MHGTGSGAGQRAHSWALPLKPRLSRHALCHLLRSISSMPCAPPLICQQCLLNYTTCPFLPQTPFREACLHFPLQDHHSPGAWPCDRAGCDGERESMCVSTLWKIASHPMSLSSADRRLFLLFPSWGWWVVVGVGGVYVISQGRPPCGA